MARGTVQDAAASAAAHLHTLPTTAVAPSSSAADDSRPDHVDGASP
jgi:hypothetical protein